MDRDECVKRSIEWLDIATDGYDRSKKSALAHGANILAAPSVAATIAGVYATLAITANSLDAEGVEQVANRNG